MSNQYFTHDTYPSEVGQKLQDHRDNKRYKEWYSEVANYFLKNSVETDEQHRHFLMVVYGKKYAGNEVPESTRRSLAKLRIMPGLSKAVARYKSSRGTDPMASAVLDNFLKSYQDKIINTFINDVGVTDVSTKDGLLLEKASFPYFKSNNGRQQPPPVGWDPNGELLLQTSLFGQLMADAQGVSEVDDPLVAFGAVQVTAAAGNRSSLLDVLEASRNAPGTKVSKKFTREELLEKRQCLLFSDLLDQGGITNKIFPNQWVYPGTNEPFYGRVLPVTPHGFDSNLLSNYLTTDKGIKSYFDDLGKGEQFLFSSFSWVYLNSKGEISEQKIYKSSAKRIQDGVATGDRNAYNFEEVDIKFEGTNPSTARNDVLVTLKLKIDSFKGIESVISRVDLGDDTVIDLKVQDLITLPTLETVETKKIKGDTVTLGSYSPDYSRIRLKIWTDPNDLDALIVDLATIKHTMERANDTTGGVTITIEYRGYFEQSLNMPHNDAFATSETITMRESFNTYIQELKNKRCSKNLIREAERSSQEFVQNSTIEMLERGDFLKRLFDRELIYTYELNTNIEALAKRKNIDLSINYLSKIYKSGNLKEQFESVSSGVTYIQDGSLLSTNSGENEDVAAAGRAVGVVTTDGVDEDFGNWVSGLLNEGEKKQDAVENLKNFYSFSPTNHCIFLGDIVTLVTDCLYKDYSSEMREGLEQMKLKFIVGTVKVPHPSTGVDGTGANPPYITINPLQIPIDLAFFIEWFHSTYVKKGVGSYPIGMFLRDLIERLVNDVLYKNCFANLLPDENPPQLRTGFFSNHEEELKYFKTRKDGWFHPYDPFAENPKAKQGLGTRSMLMQKRYNDTVDTSANYCVIYQQFPSFFRQLRNTQDGRTLKDDPYTVTMYYGANFKDDNYCSDVKFSKTDSDFLREARYFNSSQGTLSLLSNVYDLSFSFDGVKGNTHFYPGNIINFILTDWAGDSNWQVGDSLGESDPHVDGTKAYVLGFGGYFIIKAVSYKLSLKDGPGHFKIDISTKFLGTDVVSKGHVESIEDVDVTESAECIEAFNDNSEKITQFAVENQIESETGVTYLADRSETNESSDAVRETEVDENRLDKNWNQINQFIQDNLVNSKNDVISVPPQFKDALKELGYPSAIEFIKDSSGVLVRLDEFVSTEMLPPDDSSTFAFAKDQIYKGVSPAELGIKLPTVTRGELGASLNVFTRTDRKLWR